MAVDLDGTIFIVNNSTGELLTVDKDTGAATVLGTGLPTIHGLAINAVPVPGPSGAVFLPGTLFASRQRLFTIDKTTAVITIIGFIDPSHSTRVFGGLAFRSDGILFGAELTAGTGGELVQINTVTGAIDSVVGPIGPNFGQIGALAFTPEGVLLGSDILDDPAGLSGGPPGGFAIFEIDQTNGTISNVVELAFTDPPEPGSPQGMGFLRGSCFSTDTQRSIHCDDAVANDFCDSDITSPIFVYIRDGVWDGTNCQLCLSDETTASACTDGLDNDCDGLIDCADDECMQSGQCSFSSWANSCADVTRGIDYGIYETSCTDGKDNDGDGHTDCLDRDCIFGAECPSLQNPANICDLCTDENSDGIFQDFAELDLAENVSEFEQIYRCAQIYKPYCVDEEAPDPMAPTNAACDFLEWMRDKGYLPRIIAIHAEDLNDPLKRAQGEYANFQEFFDIRNEVSPPSTYRGPFKAAGNYPMDFVELRALDYDIQNDINTEFEVEGVFAEYFANRIFGRSIAVNYVDLAIDYATQFGPHAECEAPNPLKDVCFDPTTLRSGMDGLFNVFPGPPTYENFAGHFGARKLTDENESRIRLPFLFQTILSPHKQVTSQFSLAIYAHEYGHALGLGHPIALQCLQRNENGVCVSVEEYDPLRNVSRLLGTCGVMALGGYVYGCVERLEPLYRYALEPVGGYWDDATFGLQYSAEVLGACGALAPQPVFDNIQDVIDTRPLEFSTFFTDGPPIPGNGELSRTSGGNTFGEVLNPGLISVEELPNPDGIRATSSSADDVQLIMCENDQVVTLSNAVSLELSCTSSITAIADSANTELGSIQAGAPFHSRGPKIDALVPPGGEVTITRSNGWTVDSPTGVTVSLLETSPEGPDVPDKILVAVEQSPNSELRYGPPENEITEIEVIVGNAQVIGPDSSKFVVAGETLQICAGGEFDPVTVCHVPPGNPANAHTIRVGCSALPDHLAHGDSKGECFSGKKKRVTS
jgi:hypothetical protein